MSFSYAPGSRSTIEGNGFYRIKAQPIEGSFATPTLANIGPGSLIPIDVGFSAIAVGPESDYEKFELLYPDPTAPFGVQRMPFSKDRPLIGKVTSDNVGVYPDANGQIAQAFVRIADLGSVQTASSTPNGPLVSASRIMESWVDLQIYTGAPPSSFPTKRVPNRRTGFIDISTGAVDFTYLIPGYGRRILEAWATRGLAGASVDMTLSGIINGPVLEGLAGNGNGRTVARQGIHHQTDILAGPTTVSGATRFRHHHNADTNGYYDYYELLVTNVSADLPATINNFFVSMEVRD